jgi:hypothetical protein
VYALDLIAVPVVSVAVGDTLCIRAKSIPRASAILVARFAPPASGDTTHAFL